MPIDHVLVAVADVRASTAALWRQGLAAVEGGVHRGWGTANWIVPLGSAYLELVYLDDPVVAAGSPFGRRARDVIAAGGGPYAWAVAPADIDAVATRLGLALTGGSRRRPDGGLVTWRSAGLEIALADPSRPFFIDWQVPAADHPGRRSVNHRSPTPTGLRLELSGNEATVRSWLGDEEAAISMRPGEPAITAVVVETVTGAAELGAPAWG